MKKLIVKILLFAVAVVVASFYLPGITIENLVTALLVGVAVVAVNIFIKPIVKLICLPINFMTLGLFSLVINVALMYAVVYFVPGINAEGFIPALEMAGGLAVLSIILNLVL